jgi:hypothetical protein
MVKSEIYDYDFFDELDNQMNLTLLSANPIMMRQVFGALYSYYKFNRGKAEYVVYFEKILESDPTATHPKMTLDLFNVANETTLIDKDRLETLYFTYFKPNFIENWKDSISHTDSLKVAFYDSFIKYRRLDDEIWNKLIDDTIKANRVRNIENYHKMLNSIVWYNSQPDSPKFQKLDKEIESFKDKIRKNENRLWKYNVDVIN